MQNALISQERGLSSIAYSRPLGLAIPIVPSHTMFSMVETLGRHTKVHNYPISLYQGRNVRTSVVPKYSLWYALYVLSIPSHCTMGGP